MHVRVLLFLAFWVLAPSACIAWGMHGSGRHLTPNGRAVLVMTGFISLVGAIFLARTLWLLGAVP